MISQHGRAWVESFKNSVDFYKNVARMLQAADDITRPKGWYPNDDIPCIVPKKQKLKDFIDWPMWLPEFVFRQYSSQINTGVVTIAAVLHLTQNPDFPEPLCIASRVRLSDADPEEACWIPVLQAYQKNPQADGAVYSIEEDLENYFFLSEDERQRINTVVKGFLTVACPLLKITNANELEDKLITPLLSDSRWS